MYWNIDAGLTEVPEDIPTQAKKVYMFRNHIDDIKPVDFKELPDCTELWMEENQLKIISKEMWKGLNSLKLLYLSINEITHISPVHSPLFQLSQNCGWKKIKSQQSMRVHLKG